MRLLNICLENFQGIRTLEIAPSAQDADIYGDNAAGKTTVGNAIVWLLTGKSMSGDKLDPKPYDSAGHEIHNLDSTVEASLELDDGRMLTLKRVQHEVWTKKRGNPEAIYGGNTTDYYIDGVPSKEKDYTARIEGICPLDRILLLMLPRWFAANVAWKERRALLLGMCGDVSDADVLDANPELSRDLPPYLLIPGTSGQRYTVDQLREMAQAKIKAIAKQTDVLPARIDEAAKAAPEQTDEDKSILKAGVVDLLHDKLALEEEIGKLKQGGGGAAAEQIAALEKELADVRAEAYRAQTAAIEKQRAVVRKLQSEQDEIVRKHVEASREAGRLLSDAREKEQRRELLISSYKSRVQAYKDKEAEEFTGSSVCPTCGQLLPEEQVETARANFNRAKSGALESIKADMERLNEKGKRECDKDDIAALHRQAEAKQAEAESLKKQADALDEKIKAAQAESVSAPAESPCAAEIQEQIDALRAQGEEAQAPIQQAIAEKQAQLDTIRAQMDAYTAAVQRETQRKTQGKRIKELEAEQKTLSAEREQWEHGIYLCEQFTRAKVSMLDERVNGRFRSVRFRLFGEQINGGLRECCDVMVPGESGLVPYGSANNAAQINAGIEIIDVLAAHWGAQLPIIVDNAESITRLLPSEAQVIRLIVSEQDKKLHAVVRTPIAEKESA